MALICVLIENYSKNELKRNRNGLISEAACGVQGNALREKSNKIS